MSGSIAFQIALLLKILPLSSAARSQNRGVPAAAGRWSLSNARKNCLKVETPGLYAIAFAVIAFLLIAVADKAWAKSPVTFSPAKPVVR